VANELQGKRVAFLFTEGVEQAELTEPLEAVRDAGADVELSSLEKGDVQMWEHFDKGDAIAANKAVAARAQTGSTRRSWSTTDWSRAARPTTYPPAVPR
jgi:putative intracellular protease/amidase